MAKAKTTQEQQKVLEHLIKTYIGLDNFGKIWVGTRAASSTAPFNYLRLFRNRGGYTQQPIQDPESNKFWIHKTRLGKTDLILELHIKEGEYKHGPGTEYSHAEMTYFEACERLKGFESTMMRIIKEETERQNQEKALMQKQMEEDEKLMESDPTFGSWG